jgi:hypothetical protein
MKVHKCEYEWNSEMCMLGKDQIKFENSSIFYKYQAFNWIYESDPKGKKESDRVVEPRILHINTKSTFNGYSYN